MRALDFRNPPVEVEVEEVIDTNFPEYTRTVTKLVYQETELTDEMLAQLAENELLCPTKDDVASANFRSTRNDLLAECDWINGADVTMSDEKKAEWVAYRQALRDISSHEKWPHLEPEDWPTKPT